MRRQLFLMVFSVLGCFTALLAQKGPVQAIKGKITDQSLKRPLAGATLVLDGQSAQMAVSGQDGLFSLDDIAVGRHALQISYIGYKTIALNNLLLEAGKQLVLNIEMEEDISVGREVIIQSKTNKALPQNKMAMVSGRMFSVEETRRFAAGLNDPSRIAVAFAGVAPSGDGNALIIRGNAPNGLLWRLEGIDIPNPNHFSRAGSSGGGISILSAQLLANSDFITAAFPAEYGNALAGVFDIHLRKGNKDKREHTLSLSTIGCDAATEGYFKKGRPASYLVNYRYGFLTLMQKLGFNLGSKPTAFQDLSFNISLPTKKAGDFSIFGFGGLSKQAEKAVNDSVTWTREASKRSGSLDGSNTGAVGMVHKINLGKKTLLSTILSMNGFQYREADNKYERINAALTTTRDNNFSEQGLNFSVAATHKFNRHHLLKAGAYLSAKGFDLNQREAVNNLLQDKIKISGRTQLTNYYLQWKWDPLSRFSFQAGLHGQYLSLNHSNALQPRMGLRFRTGAKQYLSLGIGGHAQMQPLGNYFARIRSGNDTLQPNRNLGFSKARHYVAGYSIQLGKNWNFRTEVYYQWLYHIPISAGTATSFSVINLEDNYTISALNNSGNGQNKGVEITVERWWNDRFYLLSTLSLYQSTYKPSDGLWRSTRFNANTAATFLMGKEWTLPTKQASTLGLDLKLLHNGGVRVTPINLPLSIAQQKAVPDNSRIYGMKLPSFFRIDLQAEWKVQYSRRTGSLVIGVQNLTNHQNRVNHSYNAATKEIQYSLLQGIIPVMGFRYDF